jgi:hypothetical protein
MNHWRRPLELLLLLNPAFIHRHLWSRDRTLGDASILSYRVPLPAAFAASRSNCPNFAFV